MGKYTVNFSCGHTATVQLFGKLSERERKIEWYENSGICSDCYKKQKEEEKQKANEKAKEEASEKGLAKLNGSEKQIAWAETIRSKVIDNFILAEKRGDEFLASGKTPEENQLAAFNFVKAMVRCVSAKWWIENRYRISDVKTTLISFGGLTSDVKTITEKLTNEIKAMEA